MCFEADVLDRESKTRGDLGVAGRRMIEPLRQLRQIERSRQRPALAMARDADDVADLLLEHDPQVLSGQKIAGAALSDESSRPHRGMAGKGQLALRRENPYARRVDRVPRLKDKNGFRQVELSGDRLHAGVVQPFGVEDHGERIASERRLGEHIERLKPARHRQESGSCLVTRAGRSRR